MVEDGRKLGWGGVGALKGWVEKGVERAGQGVDLEKLRSSAFPSFILPTDFLIPLPLCLAFVVIFSQRQKLTMTFVDLGLARQGTTSS